MGRYGALADTDYDLPMLMVSPEEGDVPPESGRVGTFTGPSPRSGQAKSPVTVSSPKPTPSKKELEEGKKIGEAYRLKHNAVIGKMPPSTFVHAFPLKPKLEPEKPLFAQNFQMATPPPPAPGLERPLQALESPLPDFRPPSRKEERTITQNNQSHIAIAEKNFRFLRSPPARTADEGRGE